MDRLMDTPRADPTGDADRQKEAHPSSRFSLPPAPSRTSRCLRVVLLEYGWPLLLVGAAMTVWHGRPTRGLRLGSGVDVVVSDRLTGADAFVVPTDTQLRTTFSEY